MSEIEFRYLPLSRSTSKNGRRKGMRTERESPRGFGSAKTVVMRPTTPASSVRCLAGSVERLSGRRPGAHSITKRAQNMESVSLADSSFDIGDGYRFLTEKFSFNPVALQQRYRI